MEWVCIWTLLSFFKKILVLSARLFPPFFLRWAKAAFNTTSDWFISLLNELWLVNKSLSDCLLECRLSFSSGEVKTLCTRKHDATRIWFYVEFTIAEMWKGLVRLSSALRSFLRVFVALAMDILCASSYLILRRILLLLNVPEIER